MTPRQASVAILLQVIQHGRSLTDSLNTTLPRVSANERGFCQALTRGRELASSPLAASWSR